MNYDLIRNRATIMIKEGSAEWNIDTDNLCIDGVAYRLMPWHYNKNLKSLRNLSVDSASVGGLCSYKATRIETKTADIGKLIYSELDLCRWLTDDEITTVYALSSSDKTMSMMLKTSKGILCSIDIATTLSEETTPISKHEITGTEGMISDRCINEHIPSSDIYVFVDSKKDPTTYVDLDVHVAGLSPEEAYVTENIVKLVESREYRETTLKNHRAVMKLIDAVKYSIESGEVVISEEKA